MDDKPETKPETEKTTCCTSEAPKAKEQGKYDYRVKEHGKEGTRRKGCC